MIDPSGDVNCDGKSNRTDSGFIRQHYRGTLRDSEQCPPEGGTLYRPACDVSHDGKCDEDDAVILESGDVNCDGKADNIDALFILQYDIDKREGSNQCSPEEGTVYLPACDVSDDGECGTIDALFILQCDIGIESPFCPAARTFDNEENIEVQALQVTDSTVQQNSATLRMKPPDQVNIGETFTVIVEVESEAKIGAVKASMGFDTTQFKYEGCQDLEHEDIFFGGCNLGRKDGEDNRIIFNAIMPKGASGSLTLAKINLTHIGSTVNMDGFNLKKHTCADNGGIPLPCTISDNSRRLFLPLIY